MDHFATAAMPTTRPSSRSTSPRPLAATQPPPADLQRSHCPELPASQARVIDEELAIFSIREKQQPELINHFVPASPTDCYRMLRNGLRKPRAGKAQPQHQHHPRDADGENTAKTASPTRGTLIKAAVSDQKPSQTAGQPPKPSIAHPARPQPTAAAHASPIQDLADPAHHSAPTTLSSRKSPTATTTTTTKTTMLPIYGSSKLPEYTTPRQPPIHPLSKTSNHSTSTNTSTPTLTALLAVAVKATAFLLRHGLAFALGLLTNHIYTCVTRHSSH